MNARDNTKQKSCFSLGFIDDQKLRLKNVSILLMFFCLFFSGASIIAQESDTDLSNFNIDLRLKNMHLWQGFVVTPGIMLATSMEYMTDDKKFVAGLWGGASFDGSYKEFSYYTTYHFADNFYAQLISHNNYSNMASPDMFSYDKLTSPNFLDVVLSYTISEQLPLTLFWSTILFGQAGDYTIDNDASVTNSYSNYVELTYRLYKDENTQINAFAGGAFSFTTDKTFYSSKSDIINLGFNITQDVNLFSKKIPVTGTAFWNPHSGVGALQIDIMLF